MILLVYYLLLIAFCFAISSGLFLGLKAIKLI